MAKESTPLFDENTVVKEANTELRTPLLYKVILNNDDYTPMEFVVRILMDFFDMNIETATRIMLDVHTSGKGICGIFTREIAETKVAQINGYARENQHPLLCTMEEE